MREQNAPVPIQTVFSAGEVSKRMRGRIDTDVYKAALDECRNFIPLPQGPLLMRGGAQRMSRLWGGPSARLAYFSANDGKHYTLEFSDLELRVYSETGQEIIVGGEVPPAPPAEELIVNGDFAAGGAGWDVTSDPVLVSFAAGKVNLKYDWTYDQPSREWFETTGAFEQDFVAAQAGLHRVTYKFSSIGANEEGHIFIHQNGVGAFGSIHTSGGTFTATFNLQPGPVTIQFGVYGASHYGGGVDLDDVSLKWVGVDEPALDAALVAPWTVEQVEDLQFDSETSKNRIVIAHGNIPTQVLTLENGLWTLAAANFISKPAEWAGVNWPSTVAFHAGRLYLGGTPNEPNRVWASKAGAPFTFTMASGPVVDGQATQLPGDAIDAPLATKGKLMWMREANHALVVATDIGEHSVTGSKGAPLNGDYSFLRQSAYGSTRVQAVDAGDAILFVSPDRRRIRALGYKERDGWRSRDITFLADHVTEGRVRELHYTQAPDGMVVVVLETGGIVLCSLDLVEGIVGWFHFELAGGIVRSAAVNRDYMWLAVERPTGMWLERIPLSVNIEPLYFDGAVSAVASAAGVVSGLEHLEDETVGVRNETEFLGEFEVADGAIDLGLEYANATVQVGMRYRAKAKTLPRHLTGKARVPQVSVVLNDSALPLIDGERPPEREPSTNLDESEPLVSGVFEVTNVEWENGGAITIEQDLPFRTEVCAILGATKSNEV